MDTQKRPKNLTIDLSGGLREHLERKRGVLKLGTFIKKTLKESTGYKEKK